MKVMWCWRCGMDIPMLDEEEFERIQVALRRKPLRTPQARYCAACGVTRQPPPA
ncbi:hypothetical protein [Comamonas sp. JC664]|uniref:hypothetical protein n=1 Tax=Comamonas sp. JC664 TaxID=2801917 RepID=UPI00174ACE98|nr:hypothetical protein [Comamonas sp. JC664]MBL0698430.1 hypothetical protein [Comamonas sp. JC664]